MSVPIPRFVALAAALCTVGSLWLHWVSLSGHDQRTWTALHLAVVRWPICALALASSLAALKVGRNGGSRVVGLVVGLTQVAVAVVTIVVFEALPALIPRTVLPRTVRRYSFDLGAGLGPWAFLLGGLLLMGACYVDVVSLPSIDLGTLGAIGCLMAIEGVLLHLRTQSWVTGQAGGQEISLEGRALPWIGPLTLLVCLVAVVATGAFILTRRALCLLPAAAMSWLAVVASLVVIAFLAAVPSVHVPGVSHAIISASARPPVWIFPGTSLGLALGIAALVARER